MTYLLQTYQTTIVLGKLEFMEYPQSGTSMIYTHSLLLGHLQ
jgi:hypothetical protein